MPTEETMRAVADAYNAGITYAEIGKRYRKSPGWATHILKSAAGAGMHVSRPIRVPKPPRKRLAVSPETMVRIVGGMPVSLPRLRCLEESL